MRLLPDDEVDVLALAVITPTKATKVDSSASEPKKRRRTVLPKAEKVLEDPVKELSPPASVEEQKGAGGGGSKGDLLPLMAIALVCGDSFERMAGARLGVVLR